jgi:undecaprenyl-diphosphatase
MEAFDLAVIGWLNGFSRTNPTFDEFVHLIASNDLLKGDLLMALLWSAWMRQDSRIITGELLAVRTIAGALLAVVVGRGLQNMLPGRLRPMHEPAVNFVVPYYVHPVGLDGWSSFPSDHAVLFFALSTALFLINRPIGVMAYIWTIVVICAPRLYLGYHYPSDIAGGAVIGVLLMIVAMRVQVPAVVSGILTRLQLRYPGWLFAGAFLITLQIATLFDSSRDLLSGAIKIMSGG